jgi:anti-sigma B factor antagonist
MSLQVQRREVEGIALLSLAGRLVLGDETATLRDTLAALIADAITRVILDLKALTFIDSTGLGILVAAHTIFEKAGGGLRLLHLTQRHIQLLVLTKLTAIFRVFDDEQGAIDSFFPDRRLRSFDILEFVRSQAKETQPEKAPGVD